MSNVKISLIPWQKDYYYNRKRYNAVVAGRGSAKSFCIMMSAILDCLNFQHKVEPFKRPVVLILAEDAVTLTQIIFNPLCAWLNNSGLSKYITIHKQERKIRFETGDLVLPDIVLRGLGDDCTGDNLRGMSYYRVYIDETQNISKIDYLIDEVINPRLDYIDSCVTIYGTPKGRGTPFHKRYESAEYKIHLTSYDNPFNSRAKLDKLKQTLPDRSYRQEILASWESFAGQVFSSFNEQTNTFDNNPPFANEAIYFGYDFGSVNTAIIVLRLDNNFNFYVTDSFYNNTNKPFTVNELVNKTKELEQIHGKPFRLVVPDDRKDIQISLKDAGYTNTIVVTRNSDFIRPEHRNSLIDSLLYNNRLFIHKKQSDLINEITSFRRDENGIIIKGQKNHRIDALGYILGYLYSVNKKIRQQIPIDFTKISKQFIDNIKAINDEQ